MNKYCALLLFYAIVLAVYLVLNRIEPPARDGGLGLGGAAMLAGTLAILVYFIVAVVKGFSDSGFFIVAAIHLAILASLLFFRYR